jgi:hypothetical protein
VPHVVGSRQGITVAPQTQDLATAYQVIHNLLELVFDMAPAKGAEQ